MFLSSFSAGSNADYMTAFASCAIRVDSRCTRKRQRHNGFHWRCRSSANGKGAEKRKVLVLGGTGRVGEATARYLARFSREPIHITLAGRNLKRGRESQERVAQECRDSPHVSVSFSQVDINDPIHLRENLSNSHLVVHTAGPFQRRKAAGEVLRAAIAAKCDYIDVCDDVTHSKTCKSLSESASKAGVRGWICTGIYPGVSNLLAAACISKKPERRPCSVKFSYYTGGTGGIGATVLASTFLLLTEEALTYDRASNVVMKPPASDMQRVDFGGKIGQKNVYLLNLPEVHSIQNHLLKRTGGGEVVAKFSTDPPIWNSLLRATARLVPAVWLRNADAVQAFCAFSVPVVRLVDRISGARTGIRVDVEFEGSDSTANSGSSSSAIYEHASLKGCVGASTAAFAAEMLGNRDSNFGVFYPEELPASTCMSILKNARFESDRCVLDDKDILDF